MNFRLFQNYPNPFNASSTIEYHLPERSHVSLSIYNIAGQLIETLENQQKDAGIHTIRWEAKNASSGLYFYKIITGEYSATKKILLLK